MNSHAPNAQGSAAGQGRLITILLEMPQAHFTIYANRLGGQLQPMVGRLSIPELSLELINKLHY
jgi:hypothetical protein